MPRIGYLSLFSRSDPWGQRGIDAFRHGLRDLGYVEGQTIAIEYRWAEEKPVRLPDLAAELVHLKVDVIVAPGSQAAQAVKQATATIPIVMVAVTDPVTAGLVPAIARPGGNITGTSLIAPELVGKQLQILVFSAGGWTRPDQHFLDTVPSSLAGQQKQYGQECVRASLRAIRSGGRTGIIPDESNRPRVYTGCCPVILPSCATRRVEYGCDVAPSSPRRSAASNG